ncbi:sensor histidine kinase [Enterococcus sp. RIT-PI-f]|uniref:sensor histidine kinase n=1 Tax=Enterococcus sp. RIT-PI-f TaxID=1690244 RepID=UPI0006B99EC2|nr:ATP-binding protein [Enterococcus sp. RIT-PI-f]KPG71114.1 histidine kinase [Enterococcus sp. RIT-PI-f]
MKKRFGYSLWAILLFIVFFLCWQLLSSFYRQQVIAQQADFLEEKASIFLDLSQTQTDTLQQFADAYVQNGNSRMTLMDAQGTIIYDTYDHTLHEDRSNRPEVQAILRGSSVGQSLRESDTLHEELLYVAVPIKEDGNLTQILRIAEPTAAFFAKSQSIEQSILLVYVLFCLFISVLIFHTLRQKNRPVQTILPVIKKMISSPEQQAIIMQETPEHDELYQLINQLSEQMSQTYRAYAASEAQLYDLLGELMIGVFIIDDEDQLLLMNPTMQDQLAISQMPPMPVAFTEVIHDTQLIQLIYQFTEHTPVLHAETTIGSDHPRVLDITLRSFQEKQRIGLVYDLTRIRQLEKMQQDFVGNVSHELKTPVTSLIGFTETLLDGAKEDPQTLQAFLEIIQKDAYRLKNLIQEIIQLSKNSDSFAYEDQPIDVAALVSSITQTYKPLADQKQLVFEIHGPNQLSITSKLELLQPIIKNLIENAVTYAKHGGTITLSYQIVGSTLRLQVADQGIGIAEEDQERIFERFYRVDKARARNSGGTGLGLAIVKDYTTILGGTISVDSFPNVGTTFTLTFPLDN